MGTCEWCGKKAKLRRGAVSMTKHSELLYEVCDACASTIAQLKPDRVYTELIMRQLRALTTPEANKEVE